MKYNYVDVTVTRKESDAARYTVDIHSSMGSARGEFDDPFGEHEVENLILRLGTRQQGIRRVDSPIMADIRSFGERLFQTLFADQVIAKYSSALDQMRLTGDGILVRLRLQDVPELARWPWEFLYNRAEDSFLALSSASPVVRFLPLPQPILPLTLDWPLQILAVGCSPTDLAPLNLQAEKDALDQTAIHIADVLGGEKIQMTWLERATLLDMQHALRLREYHILHFVGHGMFDSSRDEGALAFEDDRQQAHIVSAATFVTILRNYPQLRLAVLNACDAGRSGLDDPFAGVAPALLRGGLPAVVAMQFTVPDDVAIIFAREFYRAVAESLPVHQAVTEARVAILSSQFESEWANPVLYSRIEDGRIFDIRKADTQKGTSAPKESEHAGKAMKSGKESRPKRNRIAWLLGILLFLLTVSGIVYIRLDGALAYVRSIVPVPPAAPSHTEERPDAATQSPSRAQPTPTPTATATSTVAPYVRPFELGKSFLDRRQYDAAIRQFTIAESRGLDSAELYILRGWACHEFQYYQGGCAYQTAIADYDVAIDLEPDNADYLSNRCWTYFHMDEQYRAKALADCLRVISLDPSNISAYEVSGRILVESGDVESGIEQFTAGLERDPNSPELLANRAFAYMNVGDYDAAVADLVQRSEIQPREPWAYIDLCRVYRDTGRYETAVSNCNQAVELDPENAAGWLERAHTYLAMGATHQAIADFEKRAELEPDEMWSYLDLCMVYRNARDYGRAVEYCERAVDVRSGESLPHAELCATYRAMEQYANAMDSCTEAIRIDPENSSGWLERAHTRAATGELEAALSDFLKRAELEPDQAWSYIDLCMIYREMGDLHSALDNCNRAVEVDPSNSSAWFERGSVHEAMGNISAARADRIQAERLE